MMSFRKNISVLNVSHLTAGMLFCPGVYLWISRRLSLVRHLGNGRKKTY